MYQNATHLLLRKTPNYLIAWMMVLLISSCLIVMACFYPFHPVLLYRGIVVFEDQEYYVKIYSREETVGKLNHKEVRINGQNYPLAYIKIKEALTLQNDGNVYHEVYLKTKLEKDLCIENNKVEVQFLLPKTSLFQEAIKKIKRVIYEGINKE